MSIINNRFEFVLLFDVENGNPNGDPDMGNMPRMDPQTGTGLVTDVCIKRKVRDYVDMVKEDTPGYNIYVKSGVVLNNQHKQAYDYLGIEPVDKKLPADQALATQLTQFMCKNFFDIRTFGAVMTNGVNCGQVRGPIQLNFAKSVEPVFPQEVTITRQAVTNEKDAEKGQTMGKKMIIPYGLYRLEGFVSANLAQKTGFTEEDLDLFFTSLVDMFEHDHSASRGKVSARKLIVFKHSGKFGRCQACKLFEKITVTPKCAGTVSRSFGDYDVKIDREMPAGVELIERL